MKIVMLIMLLSSACHVENVENESQTASNSGVSDSSGSVKPATLTAEVSDDGVVFRVDGEKLFFHGNKEHLFVGEHIVKGGWKDEKNVDDKVEELLRFAYAALGMLEGLYQDYRHGRQMPDHISLREMKNYASNIDRGTKELLLVSRDRWETNEDIASNLRDAFNNLEGLLDEDRLAVYGISYDELFSVMGEPVVGGVQTYVAECMRPVFSYFTKKEGDIVHFHQQIIGYVIEESGFNGKTVADVTEGSTDTIFDNFHQKSLKEKVVSVGDGKNREESYTKQVVTIFARRYKGGEEVKKVKEKFVEHVVTRQVETRNKEEAGEAIRGFINKDFEEFHPKYRKERIKQQTIAMLGTMMGVREHDKKRLQKDILADEYWRDHIAKVLDLFMHRKEIRDVDKDHFRRLAKILAKHLKGVTAGNL